jgi:hypothetical protein
VWVCVCVGGGRELRFIYMAVDLQAFVFFLFLSINWPVKGCLICLFLTEDPVVILTLAIGIHTNNVVFWNTKSKSFLQCNA